MVATSTKLIVKFSSENNCKNILDKLDLSYANKSKTSFKQVILEFRKK